jgi:hypothetical protein
MGGVKTKLLFLFVLFVGLCNAPVEVQLRLMSGEKCASTVNLDTAQPASDMYKQCMTLANQIVNSESERPVGYPLIRKQFSLITAKGEALKPEDFGRVQDETVVELTLLQIPKEIMVLPLGTHNIKLCFISCGEKFVCTDLQKTIYRYQNTNETYRAFQFLCDRMQNGAHFLSRLASDFDECIMRQRLLNGDYIERKLKFDKDTSLDVWDLNQIDQAFHNVIYYLSHGGVANILDITQEHLDMYHQTSLMNGPIVDTTRIKTHQPWKLAEITRPE